MGDYIEEAFATGYTQPSTSPAAAGFFFVTKKDGGLHPCIDYRGLNAITICYPYSLPLVRAALEKLQGDKIFNLPNSNGFTTVMVKSDCVSKACKLFPLKGLPAAMETANALFQHVFRNFGLPEDIVSDREPQLTSRVWRAFCNQLGINISLSAGYHPQSNGQAECLNQEIHIAAEKNIVGRNVHMSLQSTSGHGIVKKSGSERMDPGKLAPTSRLP
ncbi:hypothetical protein QTP70_031522, partial [Hemibagrus guttatus]